MSEHPPAAAHGAEVHAEPEFDRDVDVRRVVGVGVWLAVVIALSMVLMWFLALGLRRAERAADPARSPLPEAGARQLPPTPRLQESPERDLRQMREEEGRALTSYGWVNEAGGIARIPVERALALIAERGLPTTAPMAAPAGPPASVEGEGSHVP